MTATEDENLSFALGHAEQLRRAQINNSEDDPEGDEDSHVTRGTSVSFFLCRSNSSHYDDGSDLPPFVRVVILELVVDVYISLDCCRAESVSDLRTGPIIDADSAVV